MSCHRTQPALVKRVGFRFDYRCAVGVLFLYKSTSFNSVGGSLMFFYVV